MVRPDLYHCPVCLTPVGGLMLRRRPGSIDEETGREKFGGLYTGCECGALTKSGDGVINLLGDVAMAHGIKAKTPASIAAKVAPKKKRKPEARK